MSVSASVRTVTPAMAKKLLSDHINVRMLRRNRVVAYAHDISNDNWQCNGEAIILDDNGVLIDGQHRLHAVIEANKSIKTVVVTGISHEAVKTIDTGAKRTLADVLRMLGESNAVQLATIINAHWGYSKAAKNGGWDILQYSHRYPTRHDALEWLEKHPYLRDIPSLINSTRLTQKPVFTGIRVPAVFFALTLPKMEDVAMDFAFRVGHGHDTEGIGLKKEAPARLTRLWLQSASISGTSYTTRLGAIFEGWNAELEGRKPRFKKELELLPTPITG